MEVMVGFVRLSVGVIIARKLAVFVCSQDHVSPVDASGSGFCEMGEVYTRQWGARLSRDYPVLILLLRPPVQHLASSEPTIRRYRTSIFYYYYTKFVTPQWG